MVEIIQMIQLRNQLQRLCDQWLSTGLPSRDALLQTAEQLNRWKIQHKVPGIWPAAPLMITATLDDGIGQGIDIINIFSDIVGMKVKPLGLLQPAERIVAACLKDRPEFLGLTVLQIDSEETLSLIGQRVPSQTRIVAGGPAFKYEPEMAVRCHVHHVAVNVAAYIEYLLQLDF